MQAAANSKADGPDEFAITTNRPLEEPETLNLLPTPTPGGGNLADADPEGAAVEALGGRRVTGAGVARSSALIAYASRFGFDPAIRNRLAAEDLAFRKKHKGKLMERLFGVNRYFDSYESMSLDQNAELLRMRALGVLTPAAPPEPQ